MLSLCRCRRRYTLRCSVRNRLRLKLDSDSAVLSKQESLCKDVADALSASMKQFMKYLELRKSGKLSNAKPLSLAEARVFVILMECPLVLSEDIGCFHVLSEWLKMMEVLSDEDSKCNLGVISTIKEWLSDYADTERLQKMVMALHQWITLTVEEQEDLIEDSTVECLAAS